MDELVTLRDACLSGNVFHCPGESVRYQYIPQVHKLMAVYEFNIKMIELDSPKVSCKLFKVTDEKYS